MRALDILLVEDNPGDVFLIQEALRESNAPCHLQTATNGIAALELLSHCHRQARYPDLILLDLNLPGLNGHQVLERIKTDVKLHHVPVVILSSSRSPEDIRRAYDRHANGYVSKPRTLEEVFEVVHKIQSFWRVAQRP